MGSHYFIIIVLLGLSCSSIKKDSCDTVYDNISERMVYNTSDLRPSYNGGNLALVKFMDQNYDDSKNDPFQGSFSVVCVIDENGYLKFVRINNKAEKDYTPGEKELIRVFYLMPKWIPGKCKNQNVPCIITVPIIF